MMELVTPAAPYLASYVEAPNAGWSPDNMRPEAGRDDLMSIAADATAFLAAQTDREGSGPPVIMPDGSTAKRLPWN